MAQHVLVAYDDSPQADHALRLALTEFDDAGRMTLLTIIDPADAGYSRNLAIPSLPEEWYEQRKTAATERLGTAQRAAAQVGVDAETDIVVGRPARRIVDYANEHDVDHIVTGSHGRSGVSRILLGSVAEAVIRHADCPVTVVR
ncbi:universal stress protein [Haloarchaeobius amylolyticus]|uniref:universal stress protein n=1 Tax=Haloarchaeobius amylolyticus TaxID=1198296 RepID=UPI00226F9DA6|nr:universal stress protein [Haloarchaeobius amylolyticus]